MLLAISKQRTRELRWANRTHVVVVVHRFSESIIIDSLAAESGT